MHSSLYATQIIRWADEGLGRFHGLCDLESDIHLHCPSFHSSSHHQTSSVGTGYPKGPYQLEKRAWDDEPSSHCELEFFQNLNDYFYYCNCCICGN